MEEAMRAIIGVDPHKHVLSAVALDGRGGTLGRWQGAATGPGVRALRSWAADRAPAAVWAIEGSNSLGRRLAEALVAAGADVRDVCPTRTADRRRRRPGRGKSDAVDAEAIARELLAHPDLPRAFKTSAVGGPDPARDALAVLVRARHQVVDRHRRLLTEAEAVLTELPARTAERRPGGATVVPRLAAAARLRRTGAGPTDLRLRLLRARAREERAVAAERDALEREIGRVLAELGTSLPGLFGLGPLGAADLVVAVGDPRRFRSADAFASDAGTAPIPASSADERGRSAHHRLSRFGNRRVNSVLHVMAVTRLRTHPETQAFVARAVAGGKTTRDALRIVKHRLARLVWRTMMRDLATPPAVGPDATAARSDVEPPPPADQPADAPPHAQPVGGGGSRATHPPVNSSGAGCHPSGRSGAEEPRQGLDTPVGAEPLGRGAPP
jgi:transposase